MVIFTLIILYMSCNAREYMRFYMQNRWGFICILLGPPQ